MTRLKLHPELTHFSQLRMKAGLELEELASISGYSLRTIYRWEYEKVKPRKVVLDMMLRKVAENTAQQLKVGTKGKFTFIDLFAGIGGMRLGFESIGGKCVFTSEWDKYSQKTYAANFPDNEIIHGDITKIDAQDIPKHDVLVGGFPCQPFSIAGVSKKNSLGRAHGFLDEAQGTLFFDVARIIAHHQPTAFVLENVKNLVSHDQGNTFRVIKNALENELGYKISCKVIDARYFVPQHRERIFIVGFKEDMNFNLENIELPSANTWPTLSAILHPQDGSEVAEPPFTLGTKAKISPKYTLTPKLWEYLQAYAEKHRQKGNGFGFGLFDEKDIARTLSARYYKDGSEILIKQHGKQPRRLTPRECARLMGYETADRKFKIVVSDTQAYRQFGNGVVVPVVEAVAQYMEPYLMEIQHSISNTKEFSEERQLVAA